MRDSLLSDASPVSHGQIRKILQEGPNNDILVVGPYGKREHLEGGSIPVFLKKSIAHCDFPRGGRLVRTPCPNSGCAHVLDTFGTLIPKLVKQYVRSESYRSAKQY